jgi:predicted nucleotidyltransferase
MKLNEHSLALLREYFAGQPVKQAHLFGSFARESADAESDVDILVELDHSRPIGCISSKWASTWKPCWHGAWTW